MATSFQEDVENLERLLNEVLRGWDTSIERGVFEQGKRAGYQELPDGYAVWLTSDDSVLKATLRCKSQLGNDSIQARFMRKIAAVLNRDRELVSDERRDNDVHQVLNETRFLRAAARAMSFPTELILSRIRVFEAAARQTYEGSPFTGSVLLVKHMPSFLKRVGDRFYKFSEPLGFEQALLREKWLRPFLQNGEYSLVIGGVHGQAFGFVDTARVPGSSTAITAPCERLVGLYGHLHPGVSAWTASAHGDIFASFADMTELVNSQGAWRLRDWLGLSEKLQKLCGKGVADQVVRLIRDSSFNHRGSLISILPEGIDLESVVSGFGADRRPAQALRSAILGRNICDSGVASMLAVTSGIDGSLILDEAGEILDVASMILTPRNADLRRLGLSEAQAFAGARSTAAWNASVRGFAIKISDDGPVDAFEMGHLVFHVD